MSVELIFITVGVLFSLSFEYFPRFSGWYQALEDNLQKLFALAVSAVVVFGALGLSCVSFNFPFDIPFACSNLGLEEAVGAFFFFLVANQVTFLVAPRRAE